MVYRLESDPTAVLKKHTHSLKSLADSRDISLTIQNGTSWNSHQAPDYRYCTEFVLLMSRIIQQAETCSEIVIYPYRSDNNIQPVWCSVESQCKQNQLPKNLTEGLDIQISQTSLKQGFRVDIYLPGRHPARAKRKVLSPKAFKPARLIRPFHLKFRKQFKSHFPSIESLQENANQMSPGDGQFLEQVNALILANLDSPQFDTYALRQALTMSRPKLYRKLKPITRRSPAAYIRYMRLTKAKEKLENTNKCIGDIAFEVGYPDQSHFTRAFKKQFGFHPSFYRQQCQDNNHNSNSTSK